MDRHDLTTATVRRAKGTRYEDHGMCETRQPFDDAAAGYDHRFSESAIGLQMRTVVWSHLEKLVRPGQRVLELGCGTGEDALWLARREVEVLATDASQAMVDVTASKTAEAGLDELVTVRQLDISRLDEELQEGEGPFDGVLADFGPLNCIPDRRPLAAALARRVRPGGWVVLVVMGPLCPWEATWHLLHLEPRTALRRLRAGVVARVAGGATVAVWYPTPRRVQREFADGFVRRELLGIGCLMPPPYLSHLAHTWPRSVQLLARIEGRWRHRFPWPWLSDHFLLSLERCR